MSITLRDWKLSSIGHTPEVCLADVGLYTIDSPELMPSVGDGSKSQKGPSGQAA